MSVATLRVRTEGGPAVKTEMAELAEAAAKASQRVARAGRAGRQRKVQETKESVAQEVAAEARGTEAVVQQTARGVARQTASRRKGADESIRADQLATRSKLKELAKQGDAQKAFAALYAEMLKRATAALDREVGARGALSEREQKQVESLALAMVVSHEQAERRRTAATKREERERTVARRRSEAESRAFLRGAPSAVAGAARAGVEAFADYGDDLRARRRAREQVELRSEQIARGDIGDASAAPQITAATQAVSLQTGLDPQGVVDAIAQAQANFSNLADSASRGTYLNDVLPMLGRAAVATGSSLTDMVQAAGEFQRQMGVTNAQLPAALAQAIQGGRLGSISFSDQARHMGAIGGAAARFLSSRPEDSLQSLATTNALFQFAGRAGGGGDVSATRANAFLTNFTSARGQRALHDVLGRDVMGADGQIVTRQGENQSQAFRRTVEEAYTRTGGNSTRFLDAVAGNNVRSRALGDQLFRDLRGHGGRLTEFSGILDQSLQATAENTIDRPFQGIQGTGAIGRARRDVRDFWALSGRSTDFAGQTERQQRDFAEAHPFIARQAGDNPLFRGTMDVTNMAFQGVTPGGAAPLAPNATLADRQRGLARDIATSEVMSTASPALRMAMGPEQVERLVSQRAAEEFARLQLAEQARARGQDPLRIAPESIAALAQAIQARSPNDAAHEDMGGRGMGGSSDL